MTTFDPVQEANAAVDFGDRTDPVVSWGAVDYYRALDTGQQATWRAAYLNQLEKRGVPAQFKAANGGTP